MSEKYIYDNINTISLLMERLKRKDLYTFQHSKDICNTVNAFYMILPNTMKINKGKLLAAALLHDIGKLSISDEILNKPEPLSFSERDAMKSHAVYGRDLLNSYRLNEISDFVCYHHERIDGNGYLGMRGKDIPLKSKIISVADTYSAIVTKRPYQKARSNKEANEILNMVSGSQLDVELIFQFQQGKLNELAI